jgi:hypothetical protein
LRTLKTALKTYKNTPNAAERAITPEQFALLTDTGSPESFLTRFERECSEVDIAQAQQAPLISEVAQKAARLTLCCSHFHQVLDLAVARGAIPFGAQSFYGRDVTSNSLPDLRSYEALEEAAEHIVEGEAARQAAEGAAFVPMVMPGAAEVAAALAEFQAAQAAADTAKVRTDREREEVGALYPQAQALAVDLCDTVEFFYRRDPSAGSRRAKCARWGVVYFYEPGEPADEPGGPGGGGNPPVG